MQCVGLAAGPRQCASGIGALRGGRGRSDRRGEGPLPAGFLPGVPRSRPCPPRREMRRARCRPARIVGHQCRMARPRQPARAALRARHHRRAGADLQPQIGHEAPRGRLRAIVAQHRCRDVGLVRRQIVARSRRGRVRSSSRPGTRSPRRSPPGAAPAARPARACRRAGARAGHRRRQGSAFRARSSSRLWTWPPPWIWRTHPRPGKPGRLHVKSRRQNQRRPAPTAAGTRGILAFRKTDRGVTKKIRKRPRPRATRCIGTDVGPCFPVH